MKISKRVVFCAAHSIVDAGKCANKHGHNWEANIDVELVSGPLDNRGFIADVQDIKNAAFKYDHDDLDKYFESASTENVAQKIAEDVLEVCKNGSDQRKYSVSVHLVETENNSAWATANNIFGKKEAGEKTKDVKLRSLRLGGALNV